MRAVERLRSVPVGRMRSCPPFPGSGPPRPVRTGSPSARKGALRQMADRREVFAHRAATFEGLGPVHAFGATLLSPLMMRSIASPPDGSVRLASIFRVNFMSRGWVRPRCAAIFMTFGLPMSFTKARPSV